MQEKTYSRDGVSQVGDDIAVGGIVLDPRPKMSPEAALLAILMAKQRKMIHIVPHYNNTH